jgi:arsenite methyltransferase
MTERGIIQFDEEQSRAVEAAYRTPDVVAQRRRLVELLELQPGERVLDIGCGPGFLADEMAAAVGAPVTGIDQSESMLALARARTPGNEYRRGDAKALSFEDAAFDVITSTQVYEYVDDVPLALREARRVLRPGGRLLIMDTDWDTVIWRTSDYERHARVLKAWDAHFVHRDLPRRLPQLLREGDFELRTVEAIPFLNVGYDPQTFTGALVQFVAAFEGTEEGQAWREDIESLGPDYFSCMNRYVFVATRR